MGQDGRPFQLQENTPLDSKRASFKSEFHLGFLRARPHPSCDVYLGLQNAHVATLDERRLPHPQKRRLPRHLRLLGLPRPVLACASVPNHSLTDPKVDPLHYHPVRSSRSVAGGLQQQQVLYQQAQYQQAQQQPPG